jgi:hypothetical protein
MCEQILPKSGPHARRHNQFAYPQLAMRTCIMMSSALLFIAHCSNNPRFHHLRTHALPESGCLTCIFAALPNTSTLNFYPLVATDVDGNNTDGTGAGIDVVITRRQEAIRKVEVSIEKVDGDIDDVNTALGGGGAHLGMSGTELKDYLKQLLVKEAALLKKEVDLRDEDKALLAKRDGAAGTTTTGEGSMARANDCTLRQKT